MSEINSMQELMTACQGHTSNCAMNGKSSGGGEPATKKIIIYGISPRHYKRRRHIEMFLSDKYEILGYSDGHYNNDLLDISDLLSNKPFFKPEAICEQQVDFVLMNAESNRSHQSIRRNLVALGVPPEKIIRPMMFLEKDEYPVDLIQAIKDQYNKERGLVFGMSYSATGIIEKGLRFPFYNCSWSSLDIYYNFRIYEYMLSNRIITDVTTALWVFPYYYFDYDLSMTCL